MYTLWYKLRNLHSNNSYQISSNILLKSAFFLDFVNFSWKIEFRLDFHIWQFWVAFSEVHKNVDKNFPGEFSLDKTKSSNFNLTISIHIYIYYVFHIQYVIRKAFGSHYSIGDGVRMYVSYVQWISFSLEIWFFFLSAMHHLVSLSNQKLKFYATSASWNVNK